MSSLNTKSGLPSIIILATYSRAPTKLIIILCVVHSKAVIRYGRTRIRRQQYSIDWAKKEEEDERAGRGLYIIRRTTYYCLS